MSTAYRMLAPGPFRAEHIREGDPYEISNGHAVLCLPTGRRGGRSNLTGGSVLETDPAVKSAGVDVGYSEKPSHLRAPDVSVGDFPDEPGWATEAPPLAVEYADRGQDEADLQLKIKELLDGGTRFVWVVRLVGPRRVEVHAPGAKTRLARSGDDLVAPGILQNPVPVDALFDRDAAHEATLRNLLQRKGYASLEAVRAEAEEQGKLEGQREGKLEGQREGKLEGKREGKLEGKREGKLEGELRGRVDALFAVLGARSITLTDAQRRSVDAMDDRSALDALLARAAVATTAADLFGDSLPAGKAPRRRRRPPPR